MSRIYKSTMVSGAVIFILIPLIIGVIMYGRVVAALHVHAEERVSAQGDDLQQLFSQQLSGRLQELERVAGYFRDGMVAEERMGSSAARLLSHEGDPSIGIMRLNGEPVSGQALLPAEYPAIRSTFRGESVVRYRKGEGMLFSVPIYNNGNIKYALYEFYGEDTLFTDFGQDCFDGQAQLLLADSAQEVVMPLGGCTLAKGAPYFQEEEVKQAFSDLAKKLNLSTSAAVYCKHDGREELLFISQLQYANLFLIGIIPYENVAGDLSVLSSTIVVVYLLLLTLLIIGTVRAVTYEARARESDELREAKRSAEEASAAKGKFLANMSHELRTPINTIMGMNEMILRETDEGATRERSMDIKSAAQILLGLINDVLDFSKIESGMLSIVPAEYSLVALIRDLALLSENRARSKSLDFEMEIQPDLPIGLYGDDVRIQQVMTNLLTNAVKYTPTGSVTLRLSGTWTGEDTIVLHCEVVDTGIGIKEEDISKMFVPYLRVDENRNRKTEGTGLGLSIIINLLKLMGSELKVKSVYGEGSTFYFDLEQRVVDKEPVGDIRKRLEDGVREYEYRVACYAPRARVLVVDDNSMNRRVFTNLLRQTKIQVTAASSGKKCLELVQKEHFDLIFMDHLMPEMDGVETLQNLRKMEDNLCKDTPVIALTANAFSGAQEKYTALGFDAFLAKPINTEKLEGMLLAMLPKEYLEKPPAGTSRPSAQRPVDAVLDELPVVEGVDWDYALFHMGDAELLMDTMRGFVQDIDGEVRKLDALSQQVETEEGLARYRTQVHALKSMAATVGVLPVSELARVLERAAREEDRERIRTLTPLLLDELEQTRERLRPLAGRPTETPAELPEGGGQLPELLEMLRSAMDEMDISSTDSVMSTIKGFSYAPDVQEDIDRLDGLVSDLDFDGAGEVLAHLLSRTGGNAVESKEV